MGNIISFEDEKQRRRQRREKAIRRGLENSTKKLRWYDKFDEEYTHRRKRGVKKLVDQAEELDW